MSKLSFKRKMKTIGFVMLILSVAATCVHVYSGKISKPKHRRYKVRPINRNRQNEGQFNTLIRNMIEFKDKTAFFCYTRMRPNVFKRLLSMVEQQLKKDRRGGSLSPAHRLLMVLHYLAEGCSMQEVARDFRVGKSTVHAIITETCDILWNTLSQTFLPAPDLQRWKDISRGFYFKWNMPNCIGALDGKHVLIQCPQHSGSEYFNYKKSFSIVLMAICDAYYRFVAVEVGSPGGIGDGDAFKYSGFGPNIVHGVGLPGPVDLPNSEISMDHFLVADQAFPLSKHIMRPYPGQGLNETKQIFNYRLSRARRTIENTFGILVQRWRILRKPIIANVELCKKIVLATIVLHNFLQKSEELTESISSNCQNECTQDIDNNIVSGDLRRPCPLRSVGRIGANNAARPVLEARDRLAEYFVSDEGCVPWQWDSVSRCRVPENH